MGYCLSTVKISLLSYYTGSGWRNARAPGCRKGQINSNSDSRNSPSSMESLHPCQSVILTSRGSREVEGSRRMRRRRSGYVEMPRIRIQFSSSTATQAARVLQLSIFRGILSSVLIRDSDKWRESRSRGVEENEEVMPASTVGGRL